MWLSTKIIRVFDGDQGGDKYGLFTFAFCGVTLAIMWLPNVNTGK